MYKQFPLFQNHLDLAHDYWKRILSPGDTVIDATCGNGHDTLVLANLVLTAQTGIVFGFDVQHHALEKTCDLLSHALPPEILQRIHLLHTCHSSFPDSIPSGSVKLIVYNLGYLPGGDKSLTTQSCTTLQSLKNAADLIAPGGIISITCYPGHPEGKIESDLISNYISHLSPKEWNCCRHEWTNRKLSPVLILIQRQSTQDE